MVYGRGANVLINFVLECVALLYELQQRAFHFHFFCARMYFYLCVGVYVDDIEIKVRLSRVSVLNIPLQILWLQPRDMPLLQFVVFS